MTPATLPALPTTHPELGTRGCSRKGTLNDEIAEFFFKRDFGMHALTGPILAEFRRRNGPLPPLGYPTSDITDAFAAGVTATFEHGSITIDGAGQPSVDLGPFPAPEHFPDSS